ncbi:MAG TPA: glycoside hydrolase family 2 TIM barrel-domain containing protein [Niastella sp.]
MIKRTYYTLLLLVLLPVCMVAQPVRTVALNGQWTFALDPMKAGEGSGWYATDFATGPLDKVQVLHCFSVDPRYFFYTGTAWYFKQFAAPSMPAGYRTYLRFDAVFYKAAVWINGKKAGNHEGGYTPFEIDITDYLQRNNRLSLAVNNEWDTTTIPGAKTTDANSPANAAQLYAWMNYGGITRPVQLIVRPPVFIQRLQVMADAENKKGEALIRIKAMINNRTPQTVSASFITNMYYGKQKLAFRYKPVTKVMAANGGTMVILEGKLSAADVKRWYPDDPHLYTAEVICNNDTLTSTFGIRKVEVKGTQILLNGEPIRLGGCNRPLDYPGYGSIDPADVLEKDIKLMKQAGMEFCRLSHYPVSETLLNKADSMGLLIIAEAGNWQMTPRQMADTVMRSKFQSQLQEMIERDWNHPCVIAYSLGNEFESQTPEGQAWVKDMRGFVRTLDTTRLITFASFNVWRDYVKKPEDEASQYVDFISANVYSNHLKNLEHIHAIYPGKPIYVSEFGMRATERNTEQNRMEYFNKALQDFRRCDYLAGASVWSLNDYLSRYPGTNADGYRAWGLVTPQRQLRPSYTALQLEFAPVIIQTVKKEGEQLTVLVTARADFPARILRNYQVQYGNTTIKLNTLQPGECQQLKMPVQGEGIQLSVVQPGGFVILTHAP